jgi:hypothetical protein
MKTTEERVRKLEKLALILIAGLLFTASALAVTLIALNHLIK